MEEAAMALDSKQVVATPEQVWAVLADGWTFPVWVVGASHIRAVDDGWPQPGKRIHHSVGAWPLLIKDTTEVLEAEPPYRLLLEVRFWPLGHGHVEFTMAAETGHTVITMTEKAVGGPALLANNRAADALVSARNRETLSRLAVLVEARAQSPAPQPNR
jgi:uncharacterized protein YndB with AHSA1/START domain